MNKKFNDSAECLIIGQIKKEAMENFRCGFMCVGVGSALNGNG